MNLSRRYLQPILGKILIILLPISIIIYLLRGVGILSGMSGGVILVLFMLSFITIIAYGLEKTK